MYVYGYMGTQESVYALKGPPCILITKTNRVEAAHIEGYNTKHIYFLFISEDSIYWTRSSIVSLSFCNSLKRSFSP